MPRRNRRAGEAPPGPAPRPRSAAPVWAELTGYEIRRISSEKAYRCPGCDHPIRPGSWHLVVVPDDVPEERRHWHVECWRRELRRIGAYRPSPGWDG
jgi:hypothetical protein